MNDEIRYYSGVQNIQNERYYAHVNISGGRIQITPTAEWISGSKRKEIDSTVSPITINVSEITRMYNFFNSVTIQIGSIYHYFVFGPGLSKSSFVNPNSPQSSPDIATIIKTVYSYYKRYSQTAAQFKQQIRPAINKNLNLSRSLASNEGPETKPAIINFRKLFFILFLIGYPIFAYWFWVNIIQG